MLHQDPCPSLQQCQKKAVRWPGTWRLQPRRAISLMPSKPSQILIVQGSAWITWEVAVGHSPAPNADRFLAAGENMDVPAGVRLVMESVNPDQSVDFDWRVMPAELHPRPTHHGMALSILVRRWWQACLQLGQASGQLVQGLACHVVLGHRRFRARGSWV